MKSRQDNDLYMGHKSHIISINYSVEVGDQSEVEIVDDTRENILISNPFLTCFMSVGSDG